MSASRIVESLLAGSLALGPVAYAAEAAKPAKFTWTTSSKEAKQHLLELQKNIEHFQFGPPNVELARKIVAADPDFALGHYYLSVTLPTAEGQAELDKALELGKRASEGERRFMEAAAGIRGVQTASDPRIKDTIAKLEAVAKEYPDERLVHVVLGQLYQGQSEPQKALRAFERCEQLGPPSPRVRAFLANEDLLKGEYARARSRFEQVQASLPKGATPFAVRYGIAFSELYEGKVDAALESLRTFLEEYQANGLNQGFPEVFIWNSIARINLENGRLEEAMKAYEKGFESVPGSGLPDDQKTIWQGRLLHGRARVLARMGKQAEAWAEAEKIRKMIVDGGEQGKQFWPVWHYLAGYLKLEAGDVPAAVEHLQQADANDPFHTLLLARAYEKAGKADDARQAYERVVASTNNGIERALAYPEAKRKLATFSAASSSKS
jgi:tetratricopeptide (TPR) repeat protein